MTLHELTGERELPIVTDTGSFSVPSHRCTTHTGLDSHEERWKVATYAPRPAPMKPAEDASTSPTPAIGEPRTFGAAKRRLCRPAGVVGAVDYDFFAISPVPVALQVSLATLVPVAGHDVSYGYSDLGGAIFYTGRKGLRSALPSRPWRRRELDHVLAPIGLRYAGTIASCNSL